LTVGSKTDRFAGPAPRAVLLEPSLEFVTAEEQIRVAIRLLAIEYRVNMIVEYCGQRWGANSVVRTALAQDVIDESVLALFERSFADKRLISNAAGRTRRAPSTPITDAY
jgi:hypothetical protein